MKLVTSEEMRAIEAQAGELGVSIPALIARAGRAVADAAERLAPGGRIAILAGPGNNGSDGVEAARLLHQRGREVVLVTWKREAIQGYAGAHFRVTDDPDGSRLQELLASSTLTVDALLGSGQNRPPEADLAGIIAAANAMRGSGRGRLAVDLPTGVNADTGAVPGEAFRADSTLAMGLAKRGLALYPGAVYAGSVAVAGLGIPAGLNERVRVERTSVGEVAAALPKRAPESNKGSNGRMLFAGGSQDFTGAPMLASLAALRMGAGLVEVATPRTAHAIVAAHALEPVYWPLPSEKGRMGPNAAASLAERLEGADALVIGPGMGLSDGTITFMRQMLERIWAAKVIRGTVIDADGLNALARIPDWWKLHFPRVLTPHPGEMARLTGSSISAIQANRVEQAREHATRWDAVVVLKGAGTVIAHPDGRVAINSTGGPNLATAGTGDVLSGIIGGLIAQDCSPWVAAVCGVFLHGRAGDLLRQRWGDAGTLAGDLLTAIPEARLSILADGEVQPGDKSSLLEQA